MRNQGPELLWSLRLLLFERIDAKLLTVHINTAGKTRIKPRGALSSSLPSRAPVWS